jgi:helix-turn-helix protein
MHNDTNELYERMINKDMALVVIIHYEVIINPHNEGKKNRIEYISLLKSCE